MVRPQHMISCLQLDGKRGWWRCRVCVLNDSGACMLSHSVLLKSLWPHGLYPPGFSVCGISQPRALERVAISSFRGSSQSRDWTRVSYISCIASRFFTCWAIEEALCIVEGMMKRKWRKWGMDGKLLFSSLILSVACWFQCFGVYIHIHIE